MHDGVVSTFDIVHSFETCEKCIMIIESVSEIDEGGTCVLWVDVKRNMIKEVSAQKIRCQTSSDVLWI